MVDSFLGCKGGAFIGLVAAILLYISTQSVPGVGTDGLGNLQLGNANYYFVAEVSPHLTRIGIQLIMVSFVLQVSDGWQLKKRIAVIIGCLIGLFIF